MYMYLHICIYIYIYIYTFIPHTSWREPRRCAIFAVSVSGRSRHLQQAATKGLELRTIWAVQDTPWGCLGYQIEDDPYCNLNCNYYIIFHETESGPKLDRLLWKDVVVFFFSHCWWMILWWAESTPPPAEKPKDDDEEFWAPHDKLQHLWVVRLCLQLELLSLVAKIYSQCDWAATKSHVMKKGPIRAVDLRRCWLTSSPAVSPLSQWSSCTLSRAIHESDNRQIKFHNWS